MTRPNEIALTPASLATDGEQGEGVRACGRCGTQDSPQGVAALFLACVAMDAAQAQLEAYALDTDDPHPGTVEAADLLDAARLRMALPDTQVPGA